MKYVLSDSGNILFNSEQIEYAYIHKDGTSIYFKSINSDNETHVKCENHEDAKKELEGLFGKIKHPNL